MKKFYIRFLTLFIFLSLFTGQSAFCAEGIDVNELKKVKNITSIFKKKPKKDKAPKEIKLEEVPLDKSTFSTFEDIDDEMYSNSIKENNEDIDQSLFAPLENPGQEDKAPNYDSNVVEEVIENHDDDPKTVTDLNPIEPTTLNVANDSNNQSTSDDDDIWKF